MRPHSNPFNVTKAVDYTDREIFDTWVDLPGDPGFASVVNPLSPVPMFLVGGKGSGRTHAMRYCSLPVQRLRHSGIPAHEAIRKEGYLGIFMRCEGLDAGRFAGAQQPEGVWDAVFSHYMDLSLAYVALATVKDAMSEWGPHPTEEASFVGECARLFDIPLATPSCVDALLECIRGFRREIDVAVNNAPLQGGAPLRVHIRSTRGRLVLGVPQAAAQAFSWLGNVLFVYLLDELENFTEPQQKYLNTLIREKQLPVTFKVGSRLHGVRTHETLSAAEVNREGSEYEKVIFDERLRASPDYPAFARRLIAKRLGEARYLGEREAEGKSVLSDPAADARLVLLLRKMYDGGPTAAGDDAALTALIDEKADPAARPHMDRLRKALKDGLDRKAAPGLVSEADADALVETLAFKPSSLLEKTNTFLLYKAWAKGESLMPAALMIARSCAEYHAGTSDGPHADVLSHFRSDLVAQLLAESDLLQQYAGIDTIIAMSAGLPRNLLILLKFIHKWAVFYDERPYGHKPISLKAQRDGTRQAANWFFDDARLIGPRSQEAQDGIERLAGLFRELRFSHKPVDPSLCTFSVAESDVSEAARQNIQQAYYSSLLIRVPSGQKEKNSRRVISKYQINPMLAPRFDLPIARRGVIELSGVEGNAIFDNAHKAQFASVVKERLSRMTPPFRAVRSRKGPGSGQPGLPGLDPS